MALPDGLRNARILQGMTQHEVAKALHVSDRTISHWETGYCEPSVSQLIALADLYHISLDELIDRDFQ